MTGRGAGSIFAGSGFGGSGFGAWWCDTPVVILVCNSSRTLSFIIAPQLGQIERVGAKSRSQTGQFIVSEMN